MRINIANKSFIFILISFIILSCNNKEEKVLVFSKTEGFRHGSIEAGIVAVKKLGKENNFQVEATEDANYFVEDSLKHYASVIFLNTTMDVLDDAQQADETFKILMGWDVPPRRRFIQSRAKDVKNLDV